MEMRRRHEKEDEKTTMVKSDGRISKYPIAALALSLAACQRQFYCSDFCHQCARSFFCILFGSCLTFFAIVLSRLLFYSL